MESTTRRAFLASAATAAAAAPNRNPPPPSGPQLFVAALTMLDRSGKLDDSLNKDYLAFLATNGIEGALVMGTTGEFASFSVKERKQVLESSVKHRGKLGIMCQVATPNLPETRDLLEHAQDEGADSVLLLPPYYYKTPSLDGLAAFFEPLLNAAKVPVYLYNIPQVSGVAITADLLRRLSGHPRLAGIKDSFNKADVMTGFVRDFPKLRIMTGLPPLIQANLEAGGAGVISGNASVFGKQHAAIFDAHRRGQPLAPAQQVLVEAAKALTGYDGVPAMKYALSLRGVRESAVRPPFVPLAEGRRAELAAKLG